ncbi:hypothetical protein E2C01_041281 [Portunus trituberculatus]|uniref:Uncharacterized protein n=1 Tax=Portunus trituberculatus TaxID=210409 RepID=A0A5B7FM67_PORTR|nr:hypothetical protein [Portunus trituberculatus]
MSPTPLHCGPPHTQHYTRMSHTEVQHRMHPASSFRLPARKRSRRSSWWSAVSPYLTVASYWVGEAACSLASGNALS